MAYVEQGGAKKGIKLSLTLPDDSATSRTYSGLNMSTAGGNTAVAGASFNNALNFFSRAIAGLTNATLVHSYVITEQEYVSE